MKFVYFIWRSSRYCVSNAFVFKQSSSLWMRTVQRGYFKLLWKNYALAIHTLWHLLFNILMLKCWFVRFVERANLWKSSSSKKTVQVQFDLFFEAIYQNATIKRRGVSIKKVAKTGGNYSFWELKLRALRKGSKFRKITWERNEFLWTVKLKNNSNLQWIVI